MFTTSSILAGVTAFAALASAAPVFPRNNDGAALDVTVIKFAQILEQLETEFYTQVTTKFTDEDFTDAGFTVPAVPKQILAGILNDETIHTEYLAAALASVNSAPINCTFDFSTVTTDVATAVNVARLVEQVGVGAYIGGASLITNKAYLVAAASILTVEARHQTALNVLTGGAAISKPFDQGLWPEQVLSLAGPFITSCDGDLGLPSNPPVTLTSTPTPGQALSIDTSMFTDGQFFCQIITSSIAESTSQPIDNCIVPEDVSDGPVYVFVTNSDEPIASNVAVQNRTHIVAGPAIAFIDTVPNELTKLFTEAPAE